MDILGVNVRRSLRNPYKRMVGWMDITGTQKELLVKQGGGGHEKVLSELYLMLAH
jgi:hypothetical protein